MPLSPDNIPCLLKTNAHQFSHQPALLTEQETLSWLDLEQRVAHAAWHLQNNGITQGDHIGLIGPNSAEMIIALHALWRIGSVTCLLSPRLPKTAHAQQCQKIQCQRILDLNKDLPKSYALDHNTFSDKQIYPLDLNAVATIMFTSGSTNTPKAVVHSLNNHISNAAGANAHIPFNPSDRWLLSLPLYHVGGLSILFRALCGGGGIVIPSPLKSLSSYLTNNTITHLSLVPTQLSRLLNSNVPHSSLKAVLVGGGPIPVNLLDLAREKKLPVHITYGLTEMSSQVATSTLNTYDATILKGCSVKIIEEEIYVKGKPLFKGYLDKQTVKLPVDDEGWFPTGDRGYLTAKGTLRVTGRKDNMFISGGENIQPEEIEKYLYNLEYIEQALVVPVPHPEFGFRPVTFVQVRKGGRLEKEMIHKYLQKYLPKFKCPDHYYPWPKQNTEASLKINRRVFQALATESSSYNA